MAQSYHNIIKNLKNRILKAIAKNDLDSLRELFPLANSIPDIDINLKINKQNDTPLTLAAKLGKKDIVEFLIYQQADLNAKGENNLTATELAVNNDKFETAVVLKQHRAKLGLDTNANLKSKLKIAIRNGQVEKIKYILQLGFDKNARINDRNETPLILASKLGKIDIVHHLIYEGADLNARCELDRTAWDWAIYNKQKDIAVLLNNRTHGFDARDANNNTQLDRALSNKRFDIADFLIENGANINAHDDNNRSLLDRAMENGTYKDAQFLIKNGAFASFEAIEEYRYRFVQAIQNGRFHKVSKLASIGFNDLHFRDQNNYSPFMYSALGDNAQEFIHALTLTNEDKRNMMADLVELKLMIENDSNYSSKQQRQYTSSIEKAYNALQSELVPITKTIIDQKHPIGRVFATENYNVIARSLDKHINETKSKTPPELDIYSNIEKLGFKVAVGMAKVGKLLEDRNKTQTFSLKVKDFFNKLSNAFSILSDSYISDVSITNLTKEMNKEFGDNAKIKGTKLGLKSAKPNQSKKDKLAKFALAVTKQNSELNR